MKREGTFCDMTQCPFLAIGKCIGCNKDICHQHGSATALSVSVQRQPKDTTSFIEITRGSIPMCWRCSTALESHKHALADNITPVLAEAITTGVAAMLASETMKG